MTPITRVESRGSDSLSLEGILALFEILSINRSVIVLDISPHLIDFASGTIKFRSNVCANDLHCLLNALKSNVPIKRVDCLGLKSPNLLEVVYIFKIRLIEDFLLDSTSSSYSVDVETGALSFSPSDFTRITLSEVLSLQSLCDHSHVKSLTLHNCFVADEAYTLLCDLIRESDSLTSIDFSHCGLTDDCVLKLIAAVQSNHSIRNVNLNNNSFGIKSLSTVFELTTTQQITSNFEISPHSIDISSGTIIYESKVDHTDLISLLNSLKCNSSITRVQSLGVDSLNLEGLLTLFEILSINSRVIDLDISPHLIDISKESFCFSPSRFLSISTELISLRFLLTKVQISKILHLNDVVLLLKQSLFCVI
ncbi:hypothetical protein GEMRC1_008044 [Eukaryota sp. GEM-RC1]